jgi:hypothetical protein
MGNKQIYLIIHTFGAFKERKARGTVMNIAD